MNDTSPTLPPVPTDSDWFPVRVTSAPGAGVYLFQECWQVSGGAVADKIGGRFNTALDPAYAIDGSTFAVTAAGSAVQVLARRAPGAGGVQWELMKAAGAAGYSPFYRAAMGDGSYSPPVDAVFHTVTGLQFTVAESGYYLAMLTLNARGRASSVSYILMRINGYTGGIGNGCGLLEISEFGTAFDLFNTATMHLPVFITAGDVLTGQVAATGTFTVGPQIDASLALETTSYLTAVRLGSLLP